MIMVKKFFSHWRGVDVINIDFT